MESNQVDVKDWVQLKEKYEALNNKVKEVVVANKEDHMFASKERKELRDQIIEIQKENMEKAGVMERVEEKVGTIIDGMKEKKTDFRWAIQVLLTIVGWYGVQELMKIFGG